MDKEELKQNYASIHTLRMEGDGTPPEDVRPLLHISIHTLRMEGDSGGRLRADPDADFNPHPPHGG